MAADQPCEHPVGAGPWSLGHAPPVSSIDSGLDQPDRPLLAPHLPHGLGWIPLRQLASRLDQHIQQRFGADTRVDLLGFSMGGVSQRPWTSTNGMLTGLIYRHGGSVPRTRGR